MTLLTVAVGDLKRLCSIPAADTSQDDALTALLIAEQPVQEYALDPGVLDLAVAATVAPPAPDQPGLLATLTLGVTEVLAGRFLEQQGRFPHFAEPLPVSALNAAAAVVLTVATSDIKRLLSIPTADTSQDTAIAAQITAEQLALEYALDPAVLAAAVSVGTPNAGLNAWLTLGLSEQIAGHYLEQSGRVPGLGTDLAISSLHFTTSRGPMPDKLGVELAAQGTARLLPFLRVTRAEHRLKPVYNQPDLVKLGAALTASGLARLAPYSRAARSRTTAAAVGLDGTTPPDAWAPIPTISADPTPGASVFDRTFGDIGEADGDLARAEAEGMIYWGGPEP